MNETQLQKAIVIAVKDGWSESFMKSANGETVYDRNYDVLQRAEHLYRKYSCNLNYLMPIAVKVLHELLEMDWKISVTSVVDLKDHMLNLYVDENNQYTELFEALYNAIKLLENE
jgi:hypothetical protein